MALGRAGLNRRTALATSTLVIANNLPDLDVAVFATNTLAMSFRRGWTHGLLAQAVLPLLLAALVWLVTRRRARPADAPGAPRAPEARFSQLLLLSYIGLYSHILLDLMNSYGLRILMPFSGRWFYGDALYIIDPWMWLVLAAGVYLSAAARRRARVGRSIRPSSTRRSPRPSAVSSPIMPNAASWNSSCFSCSAWGA